ncbi:globin domain-containing protein [Rhodococcus sp. NPDC047139]|uniref:globin domain-containing protein n=1 Tax=Rhodococcus sp. NPDC047139 TaxID=3155141 RepID=UPI0033CBB450
MLSSTSRSIVEATLPAVGAEIGTISRVFYSKLFRALPSLKDTFNRTNQANGDQQRALAASVASFASLLLTEEPADIDPIMERIAAKHASLGVRSAHYEIVRTHLFAAIAEVLGEAVTPQVAIAWHEVYTLMANSLVEQETKLYRRAGVAPGDVWRSMVVAEHEYDGAHAATLHLRPADHEPLPGFLPGQYISVKVPLRDGSAQIRQYTVFPGRFRNEWAITVKRTPGGLVSPVLCDDLRAGDPLVVSLPFGSLVLDDSDEPLLLVSAGIGVTTTIAALRDLQSRRAERKVDVLHVDRTPYEQPHRTEIRALVDSLPDARLHVRYTEYDEIRSDGRTPLAGMNIPSDARTYVCGPVPFMRAIRADLVAAGVAPESIHYEAFAPGSWFGLENVPTTD